jgi:tRNA nucleotidyltransferase (CCA-adding enzyme)
MKINSNKIPKEIKDISDQLVKSGFECYLVGGCVRDLLLEREPKDWDFTTNAKPEEIQGVFPDSFYENDYGTVGVKTRSEIESLKVVEITPYRLEIGYSDKRRPDEVIFSDKIEDDLKRRDFTINALAYDIQKDILKDNFKGQEDLQSGLIRTVGDPDERFSEDALRILRAIRFSAELGFAIEENTTNSILKNSNLMSHISNERIGQEFQKIILSDNPMIGMAMSEKMHVLSHISPVFEEMIGVKQNKEAHKYDVWEHCLRSLQHAADKKYDLETRLAALFHDVSKPETKRVTKTGTSFYGHEVVGARVARETLKKLAFPRETVQKVEKLVRYHMFFSDTDQITPSAVRRLIAKVGKDHIWDLINLRICDRIGTGRPKEEPYRLRKFQSMIDEVMRDPVSVSMLKINGDSIIKDFEIKPGPKIGYILSALLEEVLEDPTKNTSEFLNNKTKELIELSDSELQKLGEKGRDTAKEAEEKEISEIRKKRKVK